MSFYLIPITYDTKNSLRGSNELECFLNEVCEDFSAGKITCYFEYERVCDALDLQTYEDIFDSDLVPQEIKDWIKKVDPLLPDGMLTDGFDFISSE